MNRGAGRSDEIRQREVACKQWEGGGSDDMAQYPHMIAHTILHTGPTCACNDDSQPPLGGGTSVLHHALRGAVRRDHRQLQGYAKLFKHLAGGGVMEFKFTKFEFWSNWHVRWWHGTC